MCKSLRALVGQQKPALTRLLITCHPGSILCYYDRHCVHYDSPNGNSVEKCFKYVECRVINSDNYEKIAFDDIAFTLENPKLSLKFFRFDGQNASQYAKLCAILESIGHKISAKACNLEISRPSEYRSILPFLKPGVLKQIAVHYINQGDVLGGEDTAMETLKQISLLEQWRQAEELDYYGIGYASFPMEYAEHFKSFYFQEGAFDLNLLNGYRDLILTLDNFEFCEIQAHIPLYEDEFRYMWKRVGVPAAANDQTKYVSHFTIPNSDDFLEFMFFIRANVVTIRKKNRLQVMEELAVENSKKSSKPSLSDMPDNVLELVIDKSDYKEQLILRKTSKTLRALVDEQKPALTRLKIYSDSGYIQCHYNDEMKIYAEPECDVIRMEYGEDHEDVIESEDFEEIALNDLIFTLKNPKLQLESFLVEVEDLTDEVEYFNLSFDLYEGLYDVLDSIDHLLSVKKCNLDISCPSNFQTILPYLEPGVLEKITVRYMNFEDDEDEDDDGTTLDTLKEEVSLLDQWKQAKELELSEVQFDDFPMEFAKHFRRFVFNEKKIDSHLLFRIRNYLSKLDNFEFCLIKSRVPFSSEDLRLLCWTVGHQAAPNEHTEFISHFSIPDSDDYLEFMFFLVNNTVTIEKKRAKNSDETSTPPKSLSDMPLDVVGLIIEKLDNKQQLRCRKVSKSFRTLVAERKPACKSIVVELLMDNFRISFDNHIVAYTDSAQLCENPDKTTSSIVRSDDFLQIAFGDLALILKNQKLRLEEFEVIEDFTEGRELDEYHNTIQRVLESLNHRVSVKSIELEVSSLSCVLTVLSCVKSGSLEKIAMIGTDWMNDSTDMDRVARLEQWKLAKELELWDFDKFPMKYATHFKRFIIDEDSMDGDKFARIKDYLSKLEHFEHCTLRIGQFNRDPNSVYELLGEAVSINTTGVIYHHAIPDSDYYFEFIQAGDFGDFLIEKKKKRDGN